MRDSSVLSVFGCRQIYSDLGNFKYGATAREVADIEHGRKLDSVVDVLNSYVQQRMAVKLIVDDEDDIYMALPQQSL